MYNRAGGPASPGIAELGAGVWRGDAHETERAFVALGTPTGTGALSPPSQQKASPSGITRAHAPQSQIGGDRQDHRRGGPMCMRASHCCGPTWPSGPTASRATCTNVCSHGLGAGGMVVTVCVDNCTAAAAMFAASVSGDWQRQPQPPPQSYEHAVARQSGASLARGGAEPDCERSMA